MADQILSVLTTATKPGKAGGDPKGAAAAGSGGITNDFLLLLLQMIPGGKAMAGNLLGKTPASLIVSDGSASVEPGKTPVAKKSHGEVKTPDGTDSVILQSMMAARQQLLAIPVPGTVLETAQILAIPVPGTVLETAPSVGSSAAADAKVQPPVLSLKAGSAGESPSQPQMKATPAANTGEETVETELINAMKQMTPVNGGSEATVVEAPKDPAGPDTKAVTASAPRPSGTEPAEPHTQKQVETQSAEEAVIMKALDGIEEKPVTESSAAGLSSAKKIQGQKVLPLQTKETTEKVEEPTEARTPSGKAATLTVEEPTGNVRRSDPKIQREAASTKGDGEQKASAAPVPSSSETSVSRIPAAAVTDAVMTPRRQAAPASKEASDQKVQPDARAEKTVLQRAAAVEQPASGQNTGDSLPGKTFAAVLQQKPGDSSVSVQQAGHVSSERAQSLPADVSQGVVDQVVKNISLQVEGKASEMRVTLKPESLGEVVVQVRMDDGKMHAQIDVGQSAVKTALETNLPQLRQALVEHGIDVQRIDITAATQSSTQESHGGQGDRSRRQGGNRRHAEVDAVESYQASRQLGYNTMEIIM